MRGASTRTPTARAPAALSGREARTAALSAQAPMEREAALRVRSRAAGGACTPAATPRTAAAAATAAKETCAKKPCPSSFASATSGSLGWPWPSTRRTCTGPMMESTPTRAANTQQEPRKKRSLAAHHERSASTKFFPPNRSAVTRVPGRSPLTLLRDRIEREGRRRGVREGHARTAQRRDLHRPKARVRDRVLERRRMTDKVACEAADAVAAAAPVDFDCVGGPTNDPSCGRCEPARPIPVMQLRGTNDLQIPVVRGREHRVGPVRKIGALWS